MARARLDVANSCHLRHNHGLPVVIDDWDLCSLAVNESGRVDNTK